jgi:bifunctional DNA-binding transcriptional regulator/antitoxin component of YhaV-PrlF toxin-antitoxin module
MALVRVKTKYQVTLPTALRQQVGLDVGDVLEARVERGKITLTPQALIDRGILEGLQDIEKGREYGPYSSVAEAMAAFKGRTAKAAKRSRRVAS